MDRPDIQYATREASKRMATPREADWRVLQRIGRYLVGVPRLVQHFNWQESLEGATIFTDSDWAGDKVAAKSTSGGAAMLGDHCLKTWTSTQNTIALSSGEAELYALVKGAAAALGIQSLLADLGRQISCKVRADSTAAIGIAFRSGLGKLRHLNVQYLWVQEKLAREQLQVEKV